MMVTRKGPGENGWSCLHFKSVRPSGLIAIGLDDDDELDWVRLTSGEDDILIVTENGQALRFNEEEVRAMGRTAQGVIGMRMKGEDQVAGVEVVTEDGDLLIITTGGIGKRTALDQYPRKGRGTMGVRTIDVESAGYDRQDRCGKSGESGG